MKYDPSQHHLRYDFEYLPEETEALRAKHQSRNPVTVDDLRRIALWKLNRVLNITDGLLEKINRLVCEPELKITSLLSKDVLSELVEQDGVGFPMASAILKFLRPDVFPIIDVRAYRAITDRKFTYSQYTLSRYLEYAATVRSIADYTGLPFNEVDEQLYCFDKKHNGMI